MLSIFSLPEELCLMLVRGELGGRRCPVRLGERGTRLLSAGLGIARKSSVKRGRSIEVGVTAVACGISELPSFWVRTSPRVSAAFLWESLGGSKSQGPEAGSGGREKRASSKTSNPLTPAAESRLPHAQSTGSTTLECPLGCTRAPPHRLPAGGSRPPSAGC